jgi:hypothetical protein
VNAYEFPTIDYPLQMLLRRLIWKKGLYNCEVVVLLQEKWNKIKADNLFGAILSYAS